MRRVGSVEAIEGFGAAVGIELERPQAESLAAYAQILRDRAVPLGLVSRKDADRLLERHVLDCLRAAPVVRDLRASDVVDLGSGAGLPGVVLAIALPDARFVLAEARAKRAGFLELAAERLGLRNTTVYPGRVQDLGVRFDAATARAFAHTAEAWGTARQLLGPGGALVLFAGESEGLPAGLAGAVSVRRLAPPEWGTSGSESLASGGDLVIITAS